MERKENKTVLFKTSMGDILAPDGSQVVSVHPQTNLKNKNTSCPFLEKIDLLLEHNTNQAEYSFQYQHKPETQTEKILNYCHLLELKENHLPPNEQAITCLTYGSDFGQKYIRSILLFINDLDDEDFKKTIYAHLCDLTHGALDVLQQIDLVYDQKGHKQMDPLIKLLCKCEILLGYWNEIKQNRTVENKDFVGLEESLISRKLYLLISKAAKLEDMKKQKINF